MRALILALLLTLGCFGQEVLLQHVCNSVAVSVTDGNTTQEGIVTDLTLDITLTDSSTLVVKSGDIEGVLKLDKVYKNEKTEEYLYLFMNEGSVVLVDQFFGALSMNVADREGLYYTIDYMCIRKGL